MNKKDSNKYDFSLFEQSPKNLKKAPKKIRNKKNLAQEQVIKNQRKKYKLSSILSYVFLSLMAMCIVGTVIISQVELTETTDKIERLSLQLSEKESEYTQLNMTLKSKFSLRFVEDYAVSNLHMSAVKNTQIKYINMTQGDKGELKSENSKVWVDVIRESISGILS